ncbi:MAG TPA: SDR family oxidoreductase [Bryobacteraceae bacterium]|nr:SDR family oxidoreductase [Bryobacteraceae bacterium]
MDKFLSGKVAVVTGGTRGIGRAIAERLLEEGASVAFCGRSAEAVATASKEMAQGTGRNVYGEAADVSKPADVRRFFQSVDNRFGALHVLINNAGVGIFRRLGELSPEEWHRMIELNLSGVFYCCREALQRLNNAGGGYIINISSLAGKNAFSGGAGYNASKFGLNGLSEALMLDYRYENIRVSYIMPGSVNTEFGSGAGTRGDWKIAPEDVAEVVTGLLRMPERTLVSRVEMRPLKPKK